MDTYIYFYAPDNTFDTLTKEQAVLYIENEYSKNNVKEFIIDLLNQKISIPVANGYITKK